MQAAHSLSCTHTDLTPTQTTLQYVCYQLHFHAAVVSFRFSVLVFSSFAFIASEHETYGMASLFHSMQFSLALEPTDILMFQL